jgi:general secretion pathway protein B
MSYILDALKKSDQERKQGDVPDLQTVHIPVTLETGPARWPYVVIVFLMLSLAFVLGTLRPWEAEPVTPVTHHVKKPVEQEISVEDSLSVEQAEIASKINLHQQQAAVPVVEKQVIAKEAPSLDIVSVPHLSEMPAMVQQAIPDMVFAGHVFSSHVEQRSVIINNHYMNEGDVVIGDLKVEQITQKGIVFKYNEHLFRIDILQDWSFD